MLELCHAQGSYCQMDSDLGGIIRYPAEEFEFFAYLSEMDEAYPIRRSAVRRKFAFGTDSMRILPNRDTAIRSN